MSGKRDRVIFLKTGLCFALAAIAVLWTALNVRWQQTGDAWVLNASAAATRGERRMENCFPQGTVPINSATAEQLCVLPGVGKVLAEAIVAERELNGSFVFPEDLLMVKGIGEKKLADLRELITLE